MKLIEDANRAWRLLSVQLALLGVAAEGTILFVPWLHDWLSDKQTHAIGGFIFVAVMVGRLIKQNGKDEKETK